MLDIDRCIGTAKLEHVFISLVSKKQVERGNTKNG
jgi:hypothetical protein